MPRFKSRFGCCTTGSKNFSIKLFTGSAGLTGGSTGLAGGSIALTGSGVVVTLVTGATFIISSTMLSAFVSTFWAISCGFSVITRDCSLLNISAWSAKSGRWLQIIPAQGRLTFVGLIPVFILLIKLIYNPANPIKYIQLVHCNTLEKCLPKLSIKF
ncbi:hypothetical protein HK413_13095 [Mucilaginibacter sp. S1162]|uniref:Uncharacterized protein n=1 Tax=Mucilaginibacter humi TaxID=2732510 RepID=A0ABX1W7F3_9SPHI|nr:hypothetical protein [Mucilaginibacter humi]NNU34755.1 hypothetical protein [Mucilaginibacter humi]